MSDDARFEDGEEKALNMGAFDNRDMQVVSSLIQDSILPTKEIKWLSSSNKLALLINRFRWEDKSSVLSKQDNLERVRSLLMISHVKSISSSGFSSKQKDKILSILSISFDGDEGGPGNVLILFSKSSICFMFSSPSFILSLLLARSLVSFLIGRLRSYARNLAPPPVL